MYNPQPAYPTGAHAAAAQAITERFTDEVDAVLLLNSCARGTASPDSCLDIGLLLRPERPGPGAADLQARNVHCRVNLCYTPYQTPYQRRV
ncbi:MAG: hypothetical protein KJZ86_20650 [Caldilineaceae bacterium]|nr:hypothetical protein [Caldilineaceae bacterium]HRJ41645.1 hypothetical protein [Caldilineaceae bacterium]